MNDQLAVITVVYENYDILEDFLKSLNDQRDKNFHLFIVDVSKNRKHIATAFSRTIIHDENKGYSYGINLGVQKAITEGFNEYCIINNDTYFGSDFVAKVRKNLKEHPHSITGGKIYYAQGYEYHKKTYDKDDLGKVLWYAGGSIDWDHALTPHRGVDEVDKGQYDTFEETQFVSGALCCFDKYVYDTIGRWDESYFLYFEDADYSVRAAKKHIKLYYNPRIHIWHKVSQSTEGSGSKLHQKFQGRNRLRFGLKYGPLRTKLHLIKNALLRS